MKKAVVFSLLLVFISISVIINSPLASAVPDAADVVQSVGEPSGPDQPLKSSAPIPSPHTLLLLGSGMIGLIIYRKKFKDKK